ncbi:C-type lectin-like [Trinorchestia longiramus]|nr:C-type lectin-like [Trinorchestia longiramus]
MAVLVFYVLPALLTTLLQGCDGAIVQRHGTTTSLMTEVQVFGLAVNTSISHKSLNTTSFCQCRSGCKTWMGCRSFSYSKKTSDCRLLLVHPLTNTVEDPDAVYFYTYATDIATEPKSSIVLESDGLYYIYLLKSYNYEQAKAYCESLPGFHLPIIITQAHFDVLSNSSVSPENGFFLGLRVNASGFYVWQNGLEFASTTQVNLQKEVTENDMSSDRTLKNFCLRQGEFEDCSQTSSLPVACQGNLDQLPWN